jgi:4-hydroxy-tetrahydrodipicolinate synthase
MRIISENRSGNTATRRAFLSLAGAAALAPDGHAAGGKPMRGVFPVMATPYTAEKAVDYDDLAREAEFLDRCGVHGIVWPQMGSEYLKLTREERLRGMQVIAKTSRGRKPALVLGVQGPNTEAALDYARHAEGLGPDALIAIPPTEAQSLDDVRRYYAALARATARPLFIQTTGGAKGIVLTPEFVAELGREFPNCGYVKEEVEPTIERMKALARSRPAMKGIFSGFNGRSMVYEASLGFDGTMPGTPYADVHAQIWDLYQGGRREQARDLFARLLLMAELEQHIKGVRPYIMRKRGIFRTMISRQNEVKLEADEIREIEFEFAALEPWLRVK